MTGSMVMAPACSARVAMQHAGTSRRNVRGKIIAVMVALTLAWCGFGALTVQRAQSDTGATQVTGYIVRPGDTLWSYASAITPAGHDVSETVDELIALNNLESGSLQAGQRIIVPVEEMKPERHGFSARTRYSGEHALSFLPEPRHQSH